MWKRWTLQSRVAKTESMVLRVKSTVNFTTESFHRRQPSIKFRRRWSKGHLPFTRSHQAKVFDPESQCSVSSSAIFILNSVFTTVSRCVCRERRELYSSTEQTAESGWDSRWCSVKTNSFFFNFNIYIYRTDGMKWNRGSCDVERCIKVDACVRLWNISHHLFFIRQWSQLQVFFFSLDWGITKVIVR